MKSLLYAAVICGLVATAADAALILTIDTTAENYRFDGSQSGEGVPVMSSLLLELTSDLGAPETGAFIDSVFSFPLLGLTTTFEDPGATPVALAGFNITRLEELDATLAVNDKDVFELNRLYDVPALSMMSGITLTGDGVTRSYSGGANPAIDIANFAELLALGSITASQGTFAPIAVVAPAVGPSVPEPSSLALLAIASCGGIFVYRRNRKLVEAQS